MAAAGVRMMQSQLQEPRYCPITTTTTHTIFNSNSIRWRYTVGASRLCCQPRCIHVEERQSSVVEDGNVDDKMRESDFTVVMKFGGSSVASADRMRQVADLIFGFPDEVPLVVLSAMGKTTNHLLNAGEKAVSCGVSKASDIPELTLIKDLHFKTVSDLALPISVISTHLEELEQLLMGVAMMKELTPRTKDYLVSFGEYILDETYPALSKRLRDDWLADPAIPIVTGFLGKARKSCAITTLGRGGSDLTATTIGKALGLREIQVWKDVDGVLTCDPTIYPRAQPVPFLTFDEAAELAYFGAQEEGSLLKIRKFGKA